MKETLEIPKVEALSKSIGNELEVRCNSFAKVT